MKYPAKLLVLLTIAMVSAMSALAQLTITPTWDSSITNLSNAIAIEAAINAAIAQTQSTITTFNLTNVSINFVIDNSSGLGSNISATNYLPYTQYLADLQSNPAKSALQTSAIATMPTGPIAALNYNTTMELTAANLAAIGETSLANATVAANGGFNGTVYLNLSIMNVSRTSGQVVGNYDLQSVAQHEIDEVLGVGGYSTSLWAPGITPTTLGSLDLFRYSANGVRSFTANTKAVSYFSIDGGKTVLTHFLQTGYGDYADFGTGVVGQNKGNNPPQVQDAVATPFGSGPIANLGVNEITAFQVIGYNLVSRPSFWRGGLSGSWIGSGNWATDAIGTPSSFLPTATDDITFSATGAANQGNTFLAQNFTIHSLKVTDPTVVTINSGPGGPFTLTISGNAGTGIDVQSGAGLLTINANLTFGGASNTIKADNSAGAVVNGVIGGTNGLIKTGTGTLTLGAVNTYTGTTTVAQGTLVTNVAGALPATTNLVLGTASSALAGTLDLNGISHALNSIAVASGNTGTGNTITSNNGPAILTVSSTTTSSTFSGVITGPLSLVKAGAGTTLTLTGANTYTGSTTITGSGSTLQIGASTAAGSIANASSVSISNGGILSLVNPTGSTFSNDVSNGVGGLGILKINAANTNTLSSSLTDGVSGTLGVTQAGTGTTILTSTAMYTGATTVTAGTLQIGDGVSGQLTGTSGVTVSGTGALAVNLADGSTFTPNIALSATGAAVKAVQSGTNTLSGLISGTGAFNQNGTGTTILNIAETYTGATNVNAGTLELNGSLAADSVVHVLTGGTLTGTGTINGNATLAGNGTINFGSGGNIAGTLGITGGNWDGQGTVSGVVTANNGAFNLNGSLTAPAGLSVTGGTLGGSGTLTGKLTYSSTASSIFGGVIAGTGTLAKSGAGTLTLTGTNTYTGATTVTAGTLQIGDGASGQLAGTSSVTVSGTGALAVNLTDGSTFTQNIALGATGASAKALQSGTNTLSGLISGTGSFNQNGTGTTILNIAESYTGATNVNAGTLELNGSLAAASFVHVLTGGTLSGTGTVKGKATLAGNGTINFGSGGNIAGTLGITGGNWSGQGTVTGLVTSSSGAFNLNGSLTAPAGLSVTGGTLGGSGTLTGKLTYSSTGSSIFGGVIAGTSTLAKSGASTLTLAGTSTYTGATTVTAGTLQIGDGVSGQLAGTSSVTVSGTGALAVNLADGSTFTQNITLSATGASVKAVQSGTNTLSALVSGSGSFNQNGTGTTILTGAKTYTGATNINAGTLQVDGSLAAASYVHVFTGGTLTGTGTIKGKATLTGNGAINFGSGGNIVGTLGITGGNWNGLGTVTGLVTSSSGAFNLNGSLTAPAGLSVTGGTLGGTGTLTGKLTYSSTASSTFGGAIAGTSTLTKSSASTLTLTGTSTYTGATTVTAGTLQIGNGISGNLAGTSGVTINSGATLALNLANGDTFSNPIKNSGHLTSNPTATSYTLSSVVTGAGNFIKNGAGAATLTGANSYTGGTAVNAGTLLVNNTSGSGTGTGAVTVNGSGTLGGSGTIKGAVTLKSGGFIAPGAGSPGVAGTTLHATSMMWNPGGTLSLQLGPAGDELVLTGALTKGSAGTYTLNLIDAGIAQSSYTLVTFASTTFTPANFTLDLPSGYTGSLIETSTSLIVNLGHTSQPVEPTSDDTLAVNEPYDAPSTTMLVAPALRSSSPMLVESEPDSLSVTPTPEPGSIALLAIGIGTLLGGRTRRRA